MNYTELAQVIWKRTQYPLHSAILVCNLYLKVNDYCWIYLSLTLLIYRYLAHSEFRAHEYLENANWYENEAVKILNSVDYTHAKRLIKFSSPRMLGKATLEDLASEGHCKLVMSHPHMQQYFDEMLYSYKKSDVISKPNRSNIWLVFLIFTFIPRYLFKAMVKQVIPTATPNTTAQPPLIDTWGNKKKAKQKEKSNSTQISTADPVSTPLPAKKLLNFGKAPEDHFHIFFNVPIVKFWTSTMFYLGFLVLQAFVLLNFNPGNIKVEEYWLWAWVAAMILEEILEICSEHGRGYLYQFTNQIDLGLIILHLLYIALRVAQVHFTNDPHHWSVAVNALLVASVLSWLRLMTVFPGPLFFILIRLVGDLAIWFVLFAIFAISFQIGFASLAIQAGVDPTLPYPHANGTFPISLVTIVGEWPYLVDVMYETPTGVLYLTIYAFIVQVMFINLLIAMMGSTYSTVRENSDVEWKYYRCGFVRDNMTSSAFPAPINFIELIRVLFKKVTKKEKLSKNGEKKEAIKMDQMSRVMRVSLDKIQAQDEFCASQSPLVQIKIVKKEIRELKTILNKHQKLMTSMMEAILDIKTGLKIEEEATIRSTTPLFIPYIDHKRKGSKSGIPFLANSNSFSSTLPSSSSSSSSSSYGPKVPPPPVIPKTDS